MIRYASSEDTLRRLSNPRAVKLKLFGTIFYDTGNFNKRPRREALNLKVLKRNFQHSQADGCVKKLPKIDYLLLNLAKKIVAISYIFKIDNYCHIPIQLKLAKYDTSFFTKDQKVHSDLHHDSSSELTWISKIKRTNSVIIFKKHVFLLVVSL